MVLLLACLALVAALGALGVSVHTWRSAPGARLWAELGLRIEDLEWENEQRRERHRRATRVENVTKATETRKELRSLKNEAAAILAAEKLDPAAEAEKRGQRRLPLSEEEQLAEVRRLAGLH
ncbi:MAG TPA: hypothetical protein VFZ54_20540 [Burkholderiales bacterium]